MQKTVTNVTLLRFCLRIRNVESCDSETNASSFTIVHANTNITKKKKPSQKGPITASTTFCTFLSTMKTSHWNNGFISTRKNTTWTKRAAEIFKIYTVIQLLNQTSATEPAKSKYCHRPSLSPWKGYLSRHTWLWKLPNLALSHSSCVNTAESMCGTSVLTQCRAWHYRHFLSAIKTAIVVVRLLQLLENCGHILMVDNCYNFPLLSWFPYLKRTFCVRTSCFIKRPVPPLLKGGEPPENGEDFRQHAEDMAVLAWSNKMSENGVHIPHMKCMWQVDEVRT